VRFAGNKETPAGTDKAPAIEAQKTDTRLDILLVRLGIARLS
jgi:hypothetical protein